LKDKRKKETRKDEKKRKTEKLKKYYRKTEESKKEKEEENKREENKKEKGLGLFSYLSNFSKSFSPHFKALQFSKLFTPCLLFSNFFPNFSESQMSCLLFLNDSQVLYVNLVLKFFLMRLKPYFKA
jgi:hypothetical protein